MKRGTKLRPRGADKDRIEKEVDPLCIQQLPRNRRDGRLLNKFLVFRYLLPCLTVIKARSSLIVPIPDPAPDGRRLDMLVQAFF